MFIQERNLSNVKLVTNVVQKVCTFQPTRLFILVRDYMGVKYVMNVLHEVSYQMNTCWVGVKNVVSHKDGDVEK
jgi:hypothetical protein